MSIYLVRHAQTQSNVRGIYAGRNEETILCPTDSRLTEVASTLEEKGVLALYSSPVRRAVDTAQVIAKYSGLDVVIDERLNELDFGTWSGKSGAEIGDEDGVVWQMWRERPFDVVPGGKESLMDLYARYNSWAQDMKRSGAKIAAVTHETLIRTAICFPNGDRNLCYRSTPVQNGSLFEIKL